MSDRPVAIVHGGGRAIDAELNRRGIAPKKVDGLRVTDAETLETVVAVLAGVANTDLVSALVAQDIPAVGLTGVDAGLGRAARKQHRATNGDLVDLGFVGDPVEPDASLLELLLVHGYVPVVASLGVEAGSHDGPQSGRAHVLNINADVMACRLAAALSADLVIAGATAGVLDQHGESISVLDIDTLDTMIADEIATAGMIAKLSACKAASTAGVSSIRIVDGRGLGAEYGVEDAPGTTVVVTTTTQPSQYGLTA